MIVFFPKIKKSLQTKFSVMTITTILIRLRSTPLVVVQGVEVTIGVSYFSELDKVW